MATRSTRLVAAPVSRRHFLRATAAAAAYAAFPFAPGRRLDMNGVQVGAISYSYRSLPGSAEETLGYLTENGMDTVELMGYTAEAFAGAPEAPPRPPRRDDVSEAERAEMRAAFAAHAEAMRDWRLQASMAPFERLGKMYNDAGVTIDILKLGDPRWSDEEIDYAFNAAKAVGARGISFEISDEAAERMAPFATKHELYVGMHNHTQVGEPGFTFEKPLSYSPYNMLNLDIGHYVAGTDESPIPVLQKYHDRITHLHLKDRKKGSNGGDNVPWGEGDTPIAEVLRLIQREGWPITAMIELEYPIPENSTVLAEMEKCVAYCRDALS